ncbi:MAG: transcription termination factor Rho, partial [Flavobacteriaceae bacterium]|nr:transcription termination factor Rho [Flavobacteriaceae bacterium]
MFEISKLKEKKLPELQEIAQELKISKFKTLKKLDLVYKILDHQASNPETNKKEAPKKEAPKKEAPKKEAPKKE